MFLREGLKGGRKRIEKIKERQEGMEMKGRKKENKKLTLFLNFGVRKYSSKRIGKCEEEKVRKKKFIILIYSIYYRYKIISIKMPSNLSNSNRRATSKEHCGWSTGLDTRSLTVGNQLCNETEIPSE